MMLASCFVHYKKNSTKTHNQYLLMHLYVTGFAKRSFPHTSSLQTFTIHNLRCVKAMNLQYAWLRALM